MEVADASLVPQCSNVEGFDIDALQKFERIDRLRILCGAQWCDCGCGLCRPTPYRTLTDLTKLPLGTLNKLAGSGRVYLTRDKLQCLTKISRLPANLVLTILNCKESP